MSRKSRQTDLKYLEWLRSQPCALAGHGVCSGPSDAHHQTGRKGLGQKNNDAQAYPLCHQHHIYERHALAGYFRGWDKQRIRDFEDQQVAASRREYLGLGEQDSLEP